MKFGDVLRQLLDDNDITQKQLANDLNIGTTTIGNYVRGLREPDFETLKLIANYFNVSVDYLLNYRTKEKTDSQDEDELLYLYRVMPNKYKKLFLEQGKLYLKFKE